MFFEHRPECFGTLYAFGEDGKLIMADSPRDSPYTNGTYFPRGNGGLTSTPTDYFRFCQMLHNGGQYNGIQPLRKETVEMMAHNLLPNDQIFIKIGGMELARQGFGLGFGVLLNEPLFGTEGDFFWPGAAYTYFFISTKNDTVAVFMTKLSDMSKMHLIWEFHELASEVLK